MNLGRSVFVVILFVVFSIDAKIRVLTFHCNKPEYILLQKQAFSKFMKEEYEIIVFNDAKDSEMNDKITKNCIDLGIQCVRYEQNWHLNNSINSRLLSLIKKPDVQSRLIFVNYPNTSEEELIENLSVRHSHVIQFALDQYGYNHDDIVVIIDGDAFPIRPLYLSELMKDCPILGVERGFRDEVQHLWVIFVAFDPRRLQRVEELKFGIGIIKGEIHDTGSESNGYLIKNPGDKVNKIPGCWSSRMFGKRFKYLLKLGFTENEIFLIQSVGRKSNVEFHIHNHILHIGASSFNSYDQEHKFNCVKEFLHKIINSSQSSPSLNKFNPGKNPVDFAIEF